LHTNFSKAYAYDRVTNVVNHLLPIFTSIYNVFFLLKKDSQSETKVTIPGQRNLR